MTIEKYRYGREFERTESPCGANFRTLIMAVFCLNKDVTLLRQLG